MNTKDETEAQKAWKEHCNKRFDDISKGINGAIKGQFQLTAISDFKASLREEIQNLLKITENELEDNTIEKQAWMEALEKTLQLLDTVKPKTE